LNDDSFTSAPQLKRGPLGGTVNHRGYVGAWGAGPFDNDDALDWLREFEAEGIQAAGAAIADVLALEGEYLEAPSASRAIAAAEAVAAASGRPAARLPSELARWLENHETFQSPELHQNALVAIKRVMVESELRDLWADSDKLDTWESTLKDLLGRLG